MKQHIYQTQGTCSQFINFELDEQQRVHNVHFIGGCAGNTIGIAQLVEGMSASEVIKRLKDIKCGYKATSCPDQLAKAIQSVLDKKQDNQVVLSE